MDEVAVLASLFDMPAIADDERDGGVPVLTGLQRQGDVYVIPAKLAPNPRRLGASRSLAAPVVVVSGSNDHELTGAGDSTWTPVLPGTPDLGVLSVPPGAVVILSHTGHHPPLGVGAGVYVLRRQVEHVERCTMGVERADADIDKWTWVRD